MAKSFGQLAGSSIQVGGSTTAGIVFIVLLFAVWLSASGKLTLIRAVLSSKNGLTSSPATASAPSSSSGLPNLQPLPGFGSIQGPIGSAGTNPADPFGPGMTIQPISLTSFNSVLA